MPDPITTPPTQTSPPTPAPSPEATSPPPATLDAGGESAQDTEAAFAEFDKEFDAQRGIKPPDKVSDKAPDKAPDKPLEDKTKTTDKTTDKEPIPDEKDGKRVTPKWYREQLEKHTAALATAQEALAAAEARVAAAEAKGKDTTTLAARLAEKEKALEEAQANLRAAKQEVSPEFQAKYDKPIQKAIKRGASEIGQLQVLDENGNAVGPANYDKHFVPLYSLPRYEAKARAVALFGDEAGLVMDHYTELHRLYDERTEGLEEEKTQWAQRTQAEEAEKVKQRQAYEAVIGKVEADIKGKYDFLQDDPKDPDWNKDLAASRALFEAKPEGFAQHAMRAVMMKHFALAARPLAEKVKRLTAALAERDATIEELKKGGPGPTKHPGGVEGPKPYKSIIEEAREELLGKE